MFLLKGTSEGLILVISMQTIQVKAVFSSKFKVPGIGFQPPAAAAAKQ